jgi:hypothetical protein
MLIYVLAIVLLGLRGVQYHTPLVPMPDAIATIALIIGMYSLLFPWFQAEQGTGVAR